MPKTSSRLDFNVLMTSKFSIQPHEFERPSLDLNGPAIRAGLQAVISGSEDHGGVERYIDAVKLKSSMFPIVFLDQIHIHL